MSLKVEIDFKVLDALLQFKVTMEYVCDYLKVSQDALRRRIREEHDKTFIDYARLRRDNTARKLQQKAIEMALGGNNTMMIFCLKNMAGWADKQEISGNEIQPLTITYVRRGDEAVH